MAYDDTKLHSEIFLGILSLVSLGAMIGAITEKFQLSTIHFTFSMDDSLALTAWLVAAKRFASGPLDGFRRKLNLVYADVCEHRGTMRVKRWTTKCDL